LCGEEEDSDIQAGSSRRKERRSWDRLQGIGKIASQLNKDGSSVDRQSCVLNAIKCSGISRISVCKVKVLEGTMEGKHFVITCTLTVNDQDIPTHALIDSGATRIAFLAEDLASQHGLPLPELTAKRQVVDIDGRPIESAEFFSSCQSQDEDSRS